MMHGGEKSDRVVVPEKSPNKAVGTAAEGVEERTLAKGNTIEASIHRTRSRVRMNQRLDRVRQAAKRDWPCLASVDTFRTEWINFRAVIWIKFRAVGTPQDDRRRRSRSPEQ
jgi:hypothetical protein